MTTKMLMVMTAAMTCCCFTMTWARMADDVMDDGLPVGGVEVGMGVPLTEEDLFSSENGGATGSKRSGGTMKRSNQADISKLLLKHLRFRQLPEPASFSSSPSSLFDRLSNSRPAKQEKRHEQRMLVNNLAALLSGLRDRQAESSMRMPSLRFGK